MRTAIPEEPLGSTGKSIPLVGFGTVEYPLNEAFKERVLHAIKLGYRHFDTAAAYPSEQPLGEALAEALRLGLVQSRDELFITSKLWLTDSYRGRVIPGLQKTLKWFYQQRVSVIVKSFNKERMEQNLDIFDWELSGEELQKIEQILQYRGSRAEAYLSENGPFRTVEEIWDGEI
ncbi:hypothetical protein CUMW_256340 [Citrus unshiu]|nr:hypothetical protein CUMW_256340 [Citrus unshiu]